MAKVVKKSPAPCYFAAAVWLFFGLVLSLYRLGDFLLCGILSVIAFKLGRKLFPNKTYTTPEPEAAAESQAAPKPAAEQKPQAPASTGNPDIDALIAERDRAIGEMRRLNANIPGEKISAQISHLEETTGKIIAQVVERPEKLPQIRKFMNYYLPTTLKILNAYDRMGAAGVEGENISATKGKIDALMDTLVTAYDKQLDALFGEEALDISTDISVMEQMLAREGLTGQTPFATGS